jgi:hypothetical protein
MPTRRPKLSQKPAMSTRSAGAAAGGRGGDEGHQQECNEGNREGGEMQEESYDSFGVGDVFHVLQS